MGLGDDNIKQQHKSFWLLHNCLLNEKKNAQIFGPRTWCTKKSFGY